MVSKLRWPALGCLGLVSVLVAVACTGQASSEGDNSRSGDQGQEEAISPALNLGDLRQLSDLQSRFNEDTGEVRVVLLLSPT